MFFVYVQAFFLEIRVLWKKKIAIEVNIKISLFLLKLGLDFQKMPAWNYTTLDVEIAYAISDYCVTLSDH